MPLIVGDAGLAVRICEAALEQGVFAQAIRPPAVPDGTSRLRLAVMASHTKDELRDAARILARAALRNGLPPVGRRCRSPPRSRRRRAACSTRTRTRTSPARRSRARRSPGAA